MTGRCCGAVCREAGIAHPVTLLRGEEGRAGRGRWLRKRLRSGGGHGIAPWDGAALDDAHLLQAEVDGRAASVAFVADGRDSRIFGLTEQLLGRSALGGSGFAWCGNVLPLELPAADAAVGARPSSSTWCRVSPGASASWASTGWTW